jgi:hypothetical protein
LDVDGEGAHHLSGALTTSTWPDMPRLKAMRNTAVPDWCTNDAATVVRKRHAGIGLERDRGLRVASGDHDS